MKRHSWLLLTFLITATAGLVLLNCCKRSNSKPMSVNINPPKEVTDKIFAKWRDARRGKHVAEDLSNPYWSWLIQSEESSWAANQHFGGPTSYDGNPAWSTKRFGQSTTSLPDGRILLIAGEHEDHYDPDFFIYNDIIVRHPDERIEILGFPESIFPPTDFHSASLVDGTVILIGNLGYPEQRKSGETQILVIDPITWKIRKQLSTGECPGWIYDHQATVEEGSIILTRGKFWTDDNTSLAENFDDWRLHLADWRWERLTHRTVTIFELVRKDGEPNELFKMGTWLFQKQYGTIPPPEMPALEGSDTLAEIHKNMKGVEPKDREAYERRHQPDGVDFKLLPKREDSLEVRIEVQSVLVRYDENYDSVRLVIEGELALELIQKLKDDLKSKLERASGKPFDAKQVKP